MTGDPAAGPAARGPADRVLGLSLAAAVATLALGVGLLFADAPVWWLGVGALAASASLLLAPARAALAAALSRPRHLGRRAFTWRAALAPRASDALAALAIVLVAALMLGDALGGARPVAGDHTVHFAKFLEAKALWADVGRPFGWSHALYAGHPVGYQYPFLPDLWVAATQAVLRTFGAGSDAASYGVAIYLFWVTLGLAVYAFGKRAFDRVVGLVAAIAYLTSTGLGFAGGWEYVMRWGVWPQWLAMAFGLFALARLDAVLGPAARPRTLAFAGLMVGLALLGHQAELLALLLATLAATLAWLWGPRPAAARPATALVQVGLVLSLGALIGAAFFLPFFSTRELTDERGNFWGTAYALGERLVTEGTLLGELPWIGIAALVGVALAWRSRPSYLAVFAAFYAALAILGSHATLLGELHLTEAQAFRHVIWYRVVELGKPFLFVLAAWSIVSVVRHLVRVARPVDRVAPTASVPTVAAPTISAPTVAASTDAVPIASVPTVAAPTAPPSRLSRAAWAFALGVALAPLAGGALAAFWTGQIARPDTPLFTPYQPTAAAQLADYVRTRLPAEDPGAPGRPPVFYRVANLAVAADRGLSDLGPTLGHPLYKPGFTPVSNYLYKVRAQTPAALNAIQVAYAIADRALSPLDYERVATFGELSLYRFKHYDPRLVRLLAHDPRQPERPLRELAGRAPIEVLHFGRERIELRVSALPPGSPTPPADTVMRLPVSAFPRWHASRDGVPVPITTLPLAPETADYEGTGFISVPYAPGSWVFTFEPSGLDLAGLWLSALGLLLVLWVALSATPLASAPAAASALPALSARDSSTAAASARDSSTAAASARPAPSRRLFARIFCAQALYQGLAARCDRLAARLAARLGPWRRRLQIGLVALVLGLGVTFVLTLGAKVPVRALPESERATHVTEVLWDADPALDDADITLGGAPCERVLGTVLCAGSDPRFEVARVPGLFGEFQIDGCLQLEAQKGKVARLAWPDLPPGDALSVMVGTRSRNRVEPPAPTTFRVLVDGRPVETVALRLRPQRERRLIDLAKLGVVRPFALALEVEVPDDDPRNTCVSAQVVRLAPDAPTPPAP